MVTWWRRQFIFIRFVDDAKFEGAVHTLEGSAAVQRDPDRVRELASRNLLKFVKEKGIVLHLRWTNPLH